MEQAVCQSLVLNLGKCMQEAVLTKAYAVVANFSNADMTNAVIDRVDFTGVLLPTAHAGHCVRTLPVAPVLLFNSVHQHAERALLQDTLPWISGCMHTNCAMPPSSV